MGAPMAYADDHPPQVERPLSTYPPPPLSAPTILSWQGKENGICISGRCACNERRNVFLIFVSSFCMAGFDAPLQICFGFPALLLRPPACPPARPALSLPATNKIRCSRLLQLKRRLLPHFFLDDRAGLKRGKRKKECGKLSIHYAYMALMSVFPSFSP